MIKTFSALAIGAILTVSSAHASVFSVNFSGTVYQTQGATGYANGGAISGHFDLDSASGNFLDFTIGGKSVAAGFQSSAVIDPGGFDAIYKAQISPVSVGGTSNNTFSLDLSSLTNWPAYDSAYSLLVDSKQLPSNLDTASNPQSAFQVLSATTPPTQTVPALFP